MNLSPVIILLTFRSKVMQELISQQLEKFPNLEIVNSSEKTGSSLNGKRLIYIWDWYDISSPGVGISKPYISSTGFSQGGSIEEKDHIIINMVKGSEQRLINHFNLREIVGLFYLDDGVSFLLKGVQQIAKGELWVPRLILQGWMKQIEMGRDEETSNELSGREKEILLMVAGGSSNREIAELSMISLNTVKSHLYKIYKKIKVTNRLGAAIWVNSNLRK